MCIKRMVSGAVLAALCLLESGGAAGLPDAGKPGPEDHGGKTVHVVFSNHLDIGFDGIDPQLGTDDAVINKYFDVYFPRAVSKLHLACGMWHVLILQSILKVSRH
jgi:hypothetical protein